MITYQQFKDFINSISGGTEPEIEFYFKNIDKTYMLILYKDVITFQECGISKEIISVEYKNFDDFANSNKVCGFKLNENWDKVEDIILNGSFSLIYDKWEEIEEYSLKFLKQRLIP